MDIICLAIIVYFESRGEPWEGQVAVASVVMNRVAHDQFPDNVCDNLIMPGQFSFWPDLYPIEDTKSWNRALAAASYAQEPTNNALFFGKSHPYTPVLTIGAHTFYTP